MSQPKPLRQVQEMITGDSTYYMVYTGPVLKLNEWLKSDKGKETILPILQTRPVRIWCPNDNNTVLRLETKHEVRAVSPNFPGSA